jgi:membrane-bound ClpP family serine protease
MLQFLSHLPPITAFVIFAAGVLLVYVEFSRPGFVLPGALGLLLTLFAVASLWRLPLCPAAIFLFGLAAVLYLVAWLYFCSLALLSAASLVLVISFAALVNIPEARPAALFTGIFLAGCTSVLIHIACRARHAKALN